MKPKQKAWQVGTKVADLLVRYSEYSTGPYKPCHRCSTLFTHLGLQAHIRTKHGGKK